MEDIDFAVFNGFLNTKQEQGVFAKFYDKYEKTGEVLDNGMPEFKCRTYVEIRVRDSLDVSDRPAEDGDIRRFPAEYHMYQIKREKTKEGTPLNQFAFLSPAQIGACDFRGIYTVEALAELDEEKAKSIGLLEESKLAKRFLEISKDNQAIAKYQAEIERLKGIIARLEEERKE